MPNEDARPLSAWRPRILSQTSSKFNTALLLSDTCSIEKLGDSWKRNYILKMKSSDDYPGNGCEGCEGTMWRREDGRRRRPPLWGGLADCISLIDFVLAALSALLSPSLSLCPSVSLSLPFYRGLRCIYSCLIFLPLFYCSFPLLTCRIKHSHLDVTKFAVICHSKMTCFRSSYRSIAVSSQNTKGARGTTYIMPFDIPAVQRSI